MRKLTNLGKIMPHRRLSVQPASTIVFAKTAERSKTQFSDLVLAYREKDEKRLNTAIDVIFREFDRVLCDGDFSQANALIPMNIEDLHTDILVAILTITFSARSYLLSRKYFLQECLKEIGRRLSPVEARALLKGLD